MSDETSRHAALVIAAIMIKLRVEYLHLMPEDLLAASEARVSCSTDVRDGSYSVYVNPKPRTVEGETKATK